MANNLKINIAQINVIPGRPDLNLNNIIKQIKKSKKQGADIVLFSEMVVPGYILGDEWENSSLVEDFSIYNQEIANIAEDIVVIWGNVDIDKSKKNEDGRPRKYNTAFVAQNKKIIFKSYKTAMPNYGEFDDSRHFFDTRKLALEEGLRVEDLVKPCWLKIKDIKLSLGIVLCEDQWASGQKSDYYINPVKILCEKGADIILNLSCSPWKQYKNDKRHRVIRESTENYKVPVLYCNNIGTQNDVDNLYVFDGSSCVYNSSGEICKVGKFFKEDLLEVSLDTNTKDVLTYKNFKDKKEDYIANYYSALEFGLTDFFKSKANKKVVIGLSGGVDSALVTCLLVRALGKNNVYAINMPSQFNSNTTKDLAKDLAKELGINYAVVPIEDSVQYTRKQFLNIKFSNKEKILINDLVFQNIQARDRGARVLAGISAGLGALFTNNGNKTEVGFGYATLYGDVNGAIAPIADLYKTEVFALSKYISKKFKIKTLLKIASITPSAELSSSQNVDEGKGDPFIFEYHDVLLKSFVELRKDPGDILESYMNKDIDTVLNLPKGTVEKYFPNPKDFVEDLEQKYKMFKIPIFKRGQAPMILRLSRRGFGHDYRETLRQDPDGRMYFTKKYLFLKRKILN